MRLKQIKLAGFKSFVDATTVAFPGNLSGIVGPNGCGKSNIIDAVRWVMGESSARYLRGESMADVIFNGSSARKPAGQAAIELHFDNAQGRLGGMYADYNDIVIRRQVNLDGQSVYSLNGTVCRRRDITDIFLGTGLGPRSYAIIEQGIISRLIEAKPEELRIYLEEAAGISKYKERRRETELRLQHTRDNLARLTDLRDELQKQLDNLSRQVATAEKYTALKEKLHLTRTQLLALRAKSLQTNIDKQQIQIVSLEETLEKYNTAWQSEATKREVTQQAYHLASEAQEASQKVYYQLNTELARLEQQMAHQREKQRTLSEGLQKAWQEAEEAHQQYEKEVAQAADIAEKLAVLLPQHAVLETSATDASDRLKHTETTLQAWQSSWDKFNQIASRNMQEAQVEQTRIQHLEKHLLTLQERLMRLEKEQERQLQLSIPDELQLLSAHLDMLSKQVTAQKQALETVKEELQNERLHQQNCERDIDAARTLLHALRGRHASLLALQEAALGKNDQFTLNWFKQHDLQSNIRLLEKITVEEGFEMALETVLSPFLEAVCITDIETVLPLLADFTEGEISFVVAKETEKMLPESAISQRIPLVSKFNSPILPSLANLLKHIYVAKNVEEAMQQLALCEDNGEDNASFVTPDGIWIGKGWLRVRGQNVKKSGILLREKELAEIQKQISQALSALKTCEEALTSSQQQLHLLENKRDFAQKELSLLSARYADTSAQCKVQEAQLKQAESRKTQLLQELSEIRFQQERETDELQAVKQRWQTLMHAVEKDSLERKTLEKQRDEGREKITEAKNKAQQLHQQLHQITTQIKVLQSQLANSEQHAARLQLHCHKSKQKQSELKTELDSLSEPEALLTATLNDHLVKQQEASVSLQEKRTQLARIETEGRECEKIMQSLEEERVRVRDELTRYHLERQTAETRFIALKEQLQEMGNDLDLGSIQKTLEANINEIMLEERIHKVLQRMERLGPVNLAAMPEYTELSARKNYLDEQHNDLITALETLEEAIHKIDKETRHRFKDIYEQVNTLFQQLFPRIFGGGNACLELTGDDLLQTGVNVIARPPGKRNSTIHLLSGGEKALTAIALVFSIFQLNPAPFCMLDEVDAPLDDANIGRFCELVQEMSKTVQFIFISHNKLAVEMAEHLIGVTMQEPGVSRLVAVDVHAAMEMAAA